ncbi:hypothetical protein Y900_005410 [Mycolicibacterium aromaticivorans JS19b1 = JCM 16368]|uniref:DUF2510 domain-containing protein n=1 Tax=Mycolicibacterium aromaticivorans JS19b1 = JCM 16368 TaxID=1440774 RepID=A0A064CCQ4_9MYCO|nr:DUF2510 domain-containing protein [Mycolicibacterium aromaticivorans]KDE98389.1 hypothetical protein Y900_005410 [Mycolicibacterium aromaticivorans JS19b1 = JCM 16368]
MSQPAGWYPDPLGGPAARYRNGTGWDGTAEEFPEPASPTTEPHVVVPSRRWLWTLGVAVTAVGAAVGATLLTLQFSEKPTAAPPVPATVTSIAPAPSPQQSSAEKAAADVKTSMQHKLDTDPDFARASLTVIDVTLVQKSGNEYKGIATVRSRDGADHQVPVDVTSDSANTLWETPPGAFLFAAPFNQPPPAPTFPVPGADDAGFLAGPRCMDTAPLIVLTAQSRVVICPDDSPAEVYEYRGLRISDGGQIELPAKRTETGGFIAVNPADGTRYVVTRDGLKIITPGGETYSEAAVAVGP